MNSKCSMFDRFNMFMFFHNQCELIFDRFNLGLSESHLKYLFWLTINVDNLCVFLVRINVDYICIYLGNKV